MATKYGGVVTCDKRNSPVMSDDNLFMWSSEVTWLIQSLISSPLQDLWQPDVMSCWLMVRRTYLWRTYLWLRDKCNIFSLAKSMAMKLGRLMTYGEVNTPIKSYVLLTTWLCKVKWQTKREIFLHTEDLWPPNFPGCWPMVRRSP